MADDDGGEGRGSMPPPASPRGVGPDSSESGLGSADGASEDRSESVSQAVSHSAQPADLASLIRLAYDGDSRAEGTLRQWYATLPAPNPPSAYRDAAPSGSGGLLASEDVGTGVAAVDRVVDPQANALHVAAEDGEPETARQIILANRRAKLGEPRIDVNGRDSQGRTPLGMAAALGKTQVVRVLVEDGGALVNDPGGNAVTPLMIAVINGHIDTARYLITVPGIKLDQDPTGMGTPLVVAVERRHLEILRLLAEYGADVDYRSPVDGYSALLKSIQFAQHEYARVLLDHNANVNLVNLRDGFTPLLLAVERGDRAMAQMLLERGADANYVDKQGFTPLLFAVDHVNEGMVRLLLRHKADPNHRRRSNDGKMDYNVLVLAIARHRSPPDNVSLVPIARRLIAAGADIERPDAVQGISPLWFAVDRGHADIVALLLEAGASSDAKRPPSMQTPLSHAVLTGELEMARLMLQHGADTAQVTGQGDTLLLQAIKSGDAAAVALPMMTFLVRECKLDINGGNPGISEEDVSDISGLHLRNPLWQAIEANNSHAVRSLLQLGADPNRFRDRVYAPSPNAHTLLMLAVQRGNAEIVDLLCKARALIEFEPASGHTALYQAIQLGRGEIVRSLVANGADTEHVHRRSRQNALMQAIQAGESSIVAWLARYGGANIRYVVPGNKQYPLQLAASLGHLDIVRMLVNLAPDMIDGLPEAQRAGTPLQAAIMNGHLKVTEYLLRSGANPNPPVAMPGPLTKVDSHVSNDSASAAAMASTAGSAGAADAGGAAATVSAGASHDSQRAATPSSRARARATSISSATSSAGGVDARPVRDGFSPLLFAVRSNNVAAATLLVSEPRWRANISVVSADGLTVFGEAAAAGNADVFRLLLRHVSRPDVFSDGDRPLVLSFAARQGSLELVKLMLLQGVDVDAVDTRGQSACAIALENRFLAIERELIRYGASPFELPRGKEQSLRRTQTQDVQRAQQQQGQVAATLPLAPMRSTRAARARSPTTRRPRSVSDPPTTALAAATTAGERDVAGVDAGNAAAASGTSGDASATGSDAARLHHRQSSSDAAALPRTLPAPQRAMAYGYGTLNDLILANSSVSVTTQQDLSDEVLHVLHADPLRRTPLFTACRLGRIAWLRWMLKLPSLDAAPQLPPRRPARLAWRDVNGWTALHEAAYAGQVEIIETLLQVDLAARPVDVNIATFAGETAVQLAQKQLRDNPLTANVQQPELQVDAPPPAPERTAGTPRRTRRHSSIPGPGGHTHARSGSARAARRRQASVFYMMPDPRRDMDDAVLHRLAVMAADPDATDALLLYLSCTDMDTVQREAVLELASRSSHRRARLRAGFPGRVDHAASIARLRDAGALSARRLFLTRTLPSYAAFLLFSFAFGLFALPWLLFTAVLISPLLPQQSSTSTTVTTTTYVPGGAAASNAVVSGGDATGSPLSVVTTTTTTQQQQVPLSLSDLAFFLPARYSSVTITRRAILSMLLPLVLASVIAIAGWHGALATIALLVVYLFVLTLRAWAEPRFRLIKHPSRRVSSVWDGVLLGGAARTKAIGNVLAVIGMVYELATLLALALALTSPEFPPPGASLGVSMLHSMAAALRAVSMLHLPSVPHVVPVLLVITAALLLLWHLLAGYLGATTWVLRTGGWQDAASSLAEQPRLRRAFPFVDATFAYARNLPGSLLWISFFTDLAFLPICVVLLHVLACVPGSTHPTLSSLHCWTGAHAALGIGAALLLLTFTLSALFVGVLFSRSAGDPADPAAVSDVRVQPRFVLLVRASQLTMAAMAQLSWVAAADVVASGPETLEMLLLFASLLAASLTCVVFAVHMFLLPCHDLGIVNLARILGYFLVMGVATIVFLINAHVMSRHVAMTILLYAGPSLLLLTFLAVMAVPQWLAARFTAAFTAPSLDDPRQARQWLLLMASGLPDQPRAASPSPTASVASPVYPDPPVVATVGRSRARQRRQSATPDSEAAAVAATSIIVAAPPPPLSLHRQSSPPPPSRLQKHATQPTAGFAVPAAPTPAGAGAAAASAPGTGRALRRAASAAAGHGTTARAPIRRATSDSTLPSATGSSGGASVSSGSGSGGSIPMLTSPDMSEVRPRAAVATRGIQARRTSIQTVVVDNPASSPGLEDDNDASNNYDGRGSGAIMIRRARPRHGSAVDAGASTRPVPVDLRAATPPRAAPSAAASTNNSSTDLPADSF